MNRTRIGTYVALIIFVAAAFGYYRWVALHGVTGVIQRLDFPTSGYVAFVRQDAGGKTDLYIVNAEGSGEPKRLTDDQAPKRAPAWSPDGTKLAYAGESRRGGTAATFQIFFLGAGDPAQATTGSIGKDQPQFSSDGRLIAYLSGGAIQSIEPNGRRGEQLYPPPMKGNAPTDGGQTSDADSDAADAAEGVRVPPIAAFRWSPVGQSMAAVQVAEGETAGAMGQGGWWLKGGQEGTGTPGDLSLVREPESLLLLPGLATKPVLLPNAQANRVGFCWFHDGTRLAVTLSTREGQHAVGIWRTDEPALLPQIVFGSTGYTVAPENPTVSPGGSRIAFEVWRLDSAENRTPMGISVVGTDPSQAVRIRDKSAAAKLKLIVTGEGSSPQWSPDGKYILFLRAGSGGRDVWVVGADGSNPRNLTKGQGDNFDPVWSPRK